MQRNYIVYFELFGKKMRSTVLADNEVHAKEIIKNKIIFHKVEDEHTEIKKVVNDLLTFFRNKIIQPKP